jgi:hypothetical protein
MVVIGLVKIIEIAFLAAIVVSLMFVLAKS